MKTLVKSLISILLLMAVSLSCVNCSNQSGKTSKIKTPDMVDLGLSVKWASFNLGATKPEEFGNLYMWAGLEAVKTQSRHGELANYPYHTGEDENRGWTKYIPSKKYIMGKTKDIPDDKIVLDPEDDVAHVALGAQWRIPTPDEWKELVDNCDTEWTTVNDIYGRMFISKKNGNSIFLPAAGYHFQSKVYEVGVTGYFWSSSLYELMYKDAIDFEIYKFRDTFAGYGGMQFDNERRYYGFSVRPVSE